MLIIIIIIIIDYALNNVFIIIIDYIYTLNNDIHALLYLIEQ